MTDSSWVQAILPILQTGVPGRMVQVHTESPGNYQSACGAAARSRIPTGAVLSLVLAHPPTLLLRSLLSSLTSPLAALVGWMQQVP